MRRMMAFAKRMLGSLRLFEVTIGALTGLMVSFSPLPDAAGPARSADETA